MRVPGQACPPLGDGPPQGNLLGRGDGRRQAGRALFRRAVTRSRRTTGALQATYHKTETAGSYVWEGAIKDYATDLRKLHSPRFEIDWETTDGCLAACPGRVGRPARRSASRASGGGRWELTWPAATFRGLQNMLCDFIENPDELKELLAIVSRGHLDKLDYLESQGLLSLNNDGTYVGSGGFGFSDELPRPISPARSARGTCGASPKARRRCTSRRRCTKSSSSPTKSRSWSASG